MQVLTFILCYFQSFILAFPGTLCKNQGRFFRTFHRGWTTNNARSVRRSPYGQGSPNTEQQVFAVRGVRTEQFEQRTAVQAEQLIMGEQSEHRTGANSPNTEQFISSERPDRRTDRTAHLERTVRTPKILKNSEQGEQSAQLLFGL